LYWICTYGLCRSFPKELSVDGLAHDDCRKKKKKKKPMLLGRLLTMQAHKLKKEGGGICMLSPKKKKTNELGNHRGNPCIASLPRNLFFVMYNASP
jgi:hypothetical protein